MPGVNVVAPAYRSITAYACNTLQRIEMKKISKKVLFSTCNINSLGRELVSALIINRLFACGARGPDKLKQLTTNDYVSRIHTLLRVQP